MLGDWLELGGSALFAWADWIRDEQPSEAQLWPEHFDLAMTAAGVNYGFSPGDEHVHDPYVYVGPHEGPPAGDEFWNAAFGAVLTCHDVRTVAEAVAFLRAGHDRLGASRG